LGGIEVTPEQKRIACAEELGWTFRAGSMVYDGAEIQFTIGIKDGIEHNPVDVPDPLTDHNAAMKLVEHMGKKGFWFTCDNLLPSWNAEFSGNEEAYQGFGDTLALAIVDAFLSATGRAK
jgi:Phage ABA sandwich domain